MDNHHGSSRNDCKLIRILLLEDNPDDADLIRIQVTAAGLEATWMRVDNQHDFKAQLMTGVDIVLSDHRLRDPTFDSLAAIAQVQALCPEVPVIVVSGSMGEEVAVQTMRHGASDYLLKDRLNRLPAAINTAISKRLAMRDKRLAEERYRTLFDVSPDAIFVLSRNIIAFLNPAALAWTGCAQIENAQGQPIGQLIPTFKEFFDQHIADSPTTDDQAMMTTRLQHPDGAIIDVEVMVSSYTFYGRPLIQLIMRDVTRHKRAVEYNATRNKLESLGRLAAGIIHDINSPLQFVSDNATFISTSWPELSECLATARPETRAEDLKFLTTEMPRAIQALNQGIGHIQGIVRTIRQFSHPDDKTRELTSVNAVVRSALTIVHAELKRVAEVKTVYDTQLPEISCNPIAITQALINLLINATHSIADKQAADPEARGQISVCTQGADGVVRIIIGDTGNGIPSEIQANLFRTSVTTKAAGHGSGQGMRIIHAIIVEQHSGGIAFTSDAGVGTTFTITLPA